ncbi:hypothetical protein LSAT2_014085 [Lamellibrachia satsuma]|nr:hypothetical protein LSAT2_014085 [Lamellibrachia satsuma]
MAVSTRHIVSLVTIGCILSMSAPSATQPNKPMHLNRWVVGLPQSTSSLTLPPSMRLSSFWRQLVGSPPRALQQGMFPGRLSKLASSRKTSDWYRRMWLPFVVG